jgi:hypothetical protein
MSDRPNNNKVLLILNIEDIKYREVILLYQTDKDFAIYYIVMHCLRLEVESKCQK